MITFKKELVTTKEYKEILYAEQKINYYKLGSVPRYINDLPNDVDYRSEVYTEKKELHKGQRKLYLSEIDFLTDYAKQDTMVVYIGAAAGHHINELYDKFKHMNLSYHLYDLNKFDQNLQYKTNITMFSEYFTDKHCAKYKQYPDILFISDIRNMEVLKNAVPIVQEDMKLQKKWVLDINPRACMLKFTLPYDSDTLVEYLDGEVRLQAYAPNSSTECRLVAEYPYKLKKYNPRDHEKRMFYLNKIIRQWYEYDEILESYILNKYDKNIID